MYQITLSLLCVLIVKTGTTVEDGYSESGLDAAMVILNMALFVVSTALRCTALYTNTSF